VGDHFEMRNLATLNETLIQTNAHASIVKRFYFQQNYFMKKICLLITCFYCFSAYSQNKKNLLYANCPGSELVKASSNDQGGGYGAQNLLSSAETIEKPSNGTSWWTDVNTPFPHVAVLKMCGDGGTISKFVISNYTSEDENSGGYRGVPAKDIIIEASVTGPETGFQKIAQLQLKRNVPKQHFDITPAKAKWIRVTIKSNYGNKEYSLLGAVEAY
jgi:hypothetical protein